MIELWYIQSQEEWLKILRACHIDPTAGHMGIKRTTSRVSERFMWSTKKANPLMSGLQSVVLGNTMGFDIEPGEFVQILHNGHGHWLTISTVGNMHPQVQVYDSAYSCGPTICKAQIAALLATVQPSIELQYMDVQMQSGSYDCALFAIAFAIQLSFLGSSLDSSSSISQR